MSVNFISRMAFENVKISGFLRRLQVWDYSWKRSFRRSGGGVCFQIDHLDKSVSYDPP